MELAHNRNVSSTSQFKITTCTLGSLARRSSQLAPLSAFTQSQLIAAQVKTCKWPNTYVNTDTHAAERLQRGKAKSEIDTAIGSARNGIGHRATGAVIALHWARGRIEPRSDWSEHASTFWRTVKAMVTYHVNNGTRHHDVAACGARQWRYG